MRTVANNICRSKCCLRLLTEHSFIPTCLPTLPKQVGVEENTTAPHGGEWTYPATAPKSCCCCCWEFPGNPDKLQDGEPRFSSFSDDFVADGFKTQRERLVLYFHGGAFVLCTPKTHRNMIMRITEYTGATVLAVDYAKPPEHPWPKPVEDCLDAYIWAIKKGPGGGNYDPSQIVFAGDSAGGGLVVAVLARVREEKLAMPAGGIMISPWLDLTDSATGTWESNQKYDYLPRDFGALFARMYAGEKYTLAEVSPCNLSTEGFPPLLVEIGTGECLLDQVRKWTEKATQDGVQIRCFEEEGMVHVFPLLFAALSTPVEEGVPASAPQAAYEHMKEFMDVVLDGDESRKSAYFDQSVRVLRTTSGRENVVEPSGVSEAQQPKQGTPL